MDSDNESTCTDVTENSYESEGDPINIEDVIDLYDHFKETFAYSPEFLGKMSSVDLTDFLMGVIRGTILIQPVEDGDDFSRMYYKELDMSFSCIRGYLKKTPHFRFINGLRNDVPSAWIEFCRTNSIRVRYELENRH